MAQMGLDRGPFRRGDRIAGSVADRAIGHDHMRPQNPVEPNAELGRHQLCRIAGRDGGQVVGIDKPRLQRGKLAPVFQPVGPQVRNMVQGGLKAFGGLQGQTVLEIEVQTGHSVGSEEVDHVGRLLQRLLAADGVLDGRCKILDADACSGHASVQ